MGRRLLVAQYLGVGRLGVEAEFFMHQSGDILHIAHGVVELGAMGIVVDANAQEVFLPAGGGFSPSEKSKVPFVFAIMVIRTGRAMLCSFFSQTRTTLKRGIPQNVWEKIQVVFAKKT